MHHPTRTIVFDLDGTLAESKQRVSANMGNLLGALLAHMPVAVMSGGAWRQFEEQLLAALPEDANLSRLYLFPDNAAQCYIYRDASWHLEYDKAFSVEERDHIFAALKEALAEAGLTDAPTPVWGERIEDRGAQITFSGLGQHAPLEAKRQWDPTGEKRQALRDALAQRLPEFAEATGGMTSVDITRKGITKAYGITRLAELTGISVLDILYVGDALAEGGNDAVVIETGVPTHAVFGPEETEHLISTLLLDFVKNK